MSDFAPTQILIDQHSSLGRPKRLRNFLTAANLLLIIMGTIWAILALVVDHPAQLVGDLVLIGIGAVSLTLVRRRAIMPAVYWSSVTLLGWIAAMGALVSGSGIEHSGAVHYWLIVYVVAVNFVLFDAARSVQTLFISMAVLLFLVLEYNVIPLAPPFYRPWHELAFSHGLTLGLVFIATAAIMRLFINEIAVAERRLTEANQRSEQLLASLLPASIIQRVRATGHTFAERFDTCSVLFADIVGFTPLAAELRPEALVSMLNEVFGRFDALTEEHGVEKIKTLGDGYMAASGIPDPQADHAARLARLALDMIDAVADIDALEIRIGVHSGPVVAGIIGRRRIAFDLWGETVNVASRLESHGVPGRVQVSAATRALLDETFPLGPPREVELKGHGPMTTYLIESGVG